MTMTVLETAIEELRSLPHERLETAARYIHRLREPDRAERDAVIDAVSRQD